MGNTLLRTIRLTGGYGRRPVLRGVDLAINEGELVAIIGPNGHGKTTLLRAISGLLPQSGGQTQFMGEDISNIPAHRMAEKGIAHVPQGDLLFPRMSVEENLIMGGYVRDRITRNAALEEVYALFPKLAERRRQIASTLSGGERRMTGIGRGLMAGAKMLMVDEPSLGLAPIVIDQIYGVLEELKRIGRSILLVEENPARIVELADQVHLIDDGAIIWSGNGGQLAESPELWETYIGEAAR